MVNKIYDNNPDPGCFKDFFIDDELYMFSWYTTLENCPVCKRKQVAWYEPVYRRTHGDIVTFYFCDIVHCPSCGFIKIPREKTPLENLIYKLKNDHGARTEIKTRGTIELLGVYKQLKDNAMSSPNQILFDLVREELRTRNVLR